MTDLSLSGLRPVGGGRLLRLLGSLSLHLSFGFGLGALLEAAGLDGGGSGRLSPGLALHGGLVGSGSGGLGTTTSLLSRHGFGDLLGSVALRLELSHLLWVNLQLLGRLGRGGLRGRGGGLSLDGLLLRLLLSHLGLRLGLGLSLRLCNLLRREAGSRILLVGGSHLLLGGGLSTEEAQAALSAELDKVGRGRELDGVGEADAKCEKHKHAGFASVAPGPA